MQYWGQKDDVPQKARAECEMLCYTTNNGGDELGSHTCSSEIGAATY
jgi:hypothetical protein